MQKINFPILQFDFCSNLKILCIPTRAFALTAFSFLEQRKEVCFSFFAFTAITHCSKNHFLSRKKSENITENHLLGWVVTYFFDRLGWIEYWKLSKKNFWAKNWIFNKVYIGSIAKKGSTRWYFSTLTHKTLTCPEKKNSVTLILSFNDCSST